MTYTCPVCGEVIEKDMATFLDHTEEHIIDIIKNQHPKWVEKNGVCPKCRDHYKKQMKGTL